jgi:hypothetical protein
MLLRLAVVHDGGVRDNDMNGRWRWRGWGGLRDGGAKPEYLVVSSEVTDVVLHWRKRAAGVGVLRDLTTMYTKRLSVVQREREVEPRHLSRRRQRAEADAR